MRISASDVLVKIAIQVSHIRTQSGYKTLQMKEDKAKMIMILYKDLIHNRGLDP